MVSNKCRVTAVLSDLFDSKMFKKVSFKSVYSFELKPNLILALTQA